MNFVDIATYMNEYCEQKDRRTIFYLVDKALKEKHNSGLFLSRFAPDSITINVDDPSEININRCIYVNEVDQDICRRNNLIYTSLLAFNTYFPELDMRNGLLNLSVVSANFDDFTYIFNEQDVEYYRQVIVNRQPIYYSDYIDQLNTSMGGKKSDSKILSYSTLEGRAFSNDDTGKVSSILLITNILVIGMLAFLMFIYL